MTILATVIVLGVLIFVHELGHFLAAKAVGVEVQRFSIGLGPKVFGFTWGETEYVLSAIPLGGYVKMGGMDDEVMERLEGPGRGERRQPSDRDFDAKPIWARTLVISAGVIMNMLFAFALYTFTFAQWGVSELATTRIGQVNAELLPEGSEALTSVEPGAEIIRIGGREVDRWSEVQEGLYSASPGPLQVELDDPAGMVEIQIPDGEPERRSLVTAIAPWIDAGVGDVNPGSPADRAGLEPGDRVVSIDGVHVSNWDEFVEEVESRPGGSVDVTLVRDGHELIRTVTLNAERETLPDGRTVEVGKIGIFPPVEGVSRDVSLSEAVTYGYGETVAVTGMILDFLRRLVTGNVSPKQMGSIVMIGEASGRAAAAGIDVFLRFMALFSINLAVLNLLPIPVLDGGHLLFLAIEALRGGKALSVEQRLRWSNVGFLVVIGLMLWALSNDFLRLLGM
ncbi:MAG: RIP metalloprotease RseP [Gemmatimonadota bacterium]